MTATIPLPDLDKLHAEASAGEWRAGSVETDAVFVPCSDCMGPERVVLRMNKSFPYEADARWIATIHNTWPTISARLKELEAENAKLKEIAWGALRGEAVEPGRVLLLEQTLRGILEEKRSDLRYHVHCGECHEGDERARLVDQIAELEATLAGAT